MRGCRFILLLALTLSVLVSTLAAQSDCSVTIAPDPPFLPLNRASSLQTSFWYGKNELWTSLPSSGIWRLPRQSDGSYINKLFLWQEGYDWKKEPRPAIIVILRRLDVQTPLIVLRGGTNAFFDNSSAMLIGIRFPTEGCWEVTSLHGGHQLTFVLSIEAPD